LSKASLLQHRSNNYNAALTEPDSNDFTHRTRLKRPGGPSFAVPSRRVGYSRKRTAHSHIPQKVAKQHLDLEMLLQAAAFTPTPETAQPGAHISILRCGHSHHVLTDRSTKPVNPQSTQNPLQSSTFAWRINQPQNAILKSSDLFANSGRVSDSNQHIKLVRSMGHIRSRSKQHGSKTLHTF
jgi:hypothetical protein